MPESARRCRRTQDPCHTGRGGGGARLAAHARDGWLYLGLAAVVGACWAVTRLGLYTTKSDFAYWLGVAGGVGMCCCC